MNEIEIELSIEELADRWELLNWEQGIENLKVTECFCSSPKRTFFVKNLSIEMDDALVCCSDSDGVMVKEFGALLLFPRTRLQSIHIVTNNGTSKEVLEFVDGVIYVEKA